MPDEDFESHTEVVGKSELEFLDGPPAVSVHHHINLIMIGVDSLHDSHLDPAQRLEITFHAKCIRDTQSL